MGDGHGSSGVDNHEGVKDELSDGSRKDCDSADRVAARPDHWSAPSSLHDESVQWLSRLTTSAAGGGVAGAGVGPPFVVTSTHLTQAPLQQSLALMSARLVMHW